MMAIPARATCRLSETQVRFKPVVVMVGPTAVGKSRVAVEVAKAFETEVLTADSRQVYRGMDVGTDKPVPEERQAVPHRLIDLVDPAETFNAGLYRRQAVDEIERLHRDRRLPLVVGGTGLYVRTLLKGLCERTTGRSDCAGCPAAGGEVSRIRSPLYETRGCRSCGRGAVAPTRRIESDPCAGGAPAIRPSDV